MIQSPVFGNVTDLAFVGQLNLLAERGAVRLSPPIDRTGMSTWFAPID
jgi:hypothetical protein